MGRRKPKADDVLTPKQRAFVDAYLGSANFNATEAARVAGYKGNDVTLAAVGSENLRKPQVKQFIDAAIEKRSAKAIVTQEQVLRELALVGFSDLRRFAAWGVPAELTPDQLQLLQAAHFDIPAGNRVRGLDYRAAKYLEENGLPVQWRTVDLVPSETLGEESRALQSVSESQHGVKVKMHDKLKALELLGRHLRMWVEKLEHSGPNGAPLNPVAEVDLTKLSRDELDQWIALAEKAARK